MGLGYGLLKNRILKDFVFEFWESAIHGSKAFPAHIAGAGTNLSPTRIISQTQFLGERGVRHVQCALYRFQLFNEAHMFLLLLLPCVAFEEWLKQTRKNRMPCALAILDDVRPQRVSELFGNEHL